MENVVIFVWPQFWHILPKTGAQVFQNQGDRTNSFLTPLRNLFSTYFLSKTHITTPKLMISKNVPIKTIGKLSKNLILKMSFFLYRNRVGPFVYFDFLRSPLMDFIQFFFEYG